MFDLDKKEASLNKGTGERRRTHLIQNVPGSGDGEEVDVHHQPGAACLRQLHLLLQKLLLTSGHLFDIHISKQSLRETE